MVVGQIIALHVIHPQKKCRRVGFLAYRAQYTLGTQC
jgi:hypothetical protein